MDDQNAGSQQPAENLISRPPTEADLVNLCRELNRRGAISDGVYRELIGDIDTQLNELSVPRAPRPADELTPAEENKATET